MSRILIEGKALVRVGCSFRCPEAFFKFQRILNQLDLVCPEEDPFSLFDAVRCGQARFFKLLFAVVNDALQRMMNIAHVPVFKQQLFQPVTGNAMFAVMDQNLQKTCVLRITGLGAAGNQFAVPAHGKPAQHPDIQYIRF